MFNFHWSRGKIRTGVVVICALFLIAAGLLLRDGKAAAEIAPSRAVVINEVMWAGIQYAELYNNTEEDINLEGWQLIRERLVNNEPQVVTVNFEEEDQIAARGYFLLERYVGGQTDAKATEFDGPGRVISGISLGLVNAGERLELRDEEGALVDEVGALNPWPAGKNEDGGRSMERINTLNSGTDRCNWHTYGSDAVNYGRLGTPGEDNSEFINPLKAVIDTAAQQITLGEKAELSAEGSVGLENGELAYMWDFGDGHTMSGKTAVHEYNAQGKYEISLTVSDCDWQDTVKATVEVLAEEDDAGEDIEPPSVAKHKHVDLKDIRQEDKGALLSVEGIVNAVPGVFGDRIMYVTDVSGASGIQVYWHNANWPKLNPGDVVRINGELTATLGEARLKVSQAQDVIPQGKNISFVLSVLKTGEVGASVEGALIAVNGTVTRSSGNTFHIDDGSGELRIVVRNTTGIKKPSTRRGTKVKITGIVSRTTIGYRLMPRFQADVEVIEMDGDGNEDGWAEEEVLGDNIEQVELKDIRQQEIGAVVVTEGIVSVPPKVLADRIMYLSGSGIQVYFHRADWPELNLGDRVRVTGELATSLGETRLKVASETDVVKIEDGVSPEPKEVATGAVGEDLEGSLVKMAGHITKTSGATYYIDDGSGEVRIVIQKQTGINKPRTKKGDKASVVGVVSHTNAGYRVLPRYQEDVAFGGQVQGLKSFPAAGYLKAHTGPAANMLYFLGGAAAALLLSSAYRSGEPLIKLSRK